MAFHEASPNCRFSSLPRVWLWDLVGDLICTAFRAALPHHDASSRLIEHFCDAGQPHPALCSEVLAGGGAESPLYAWATETLRSVLPQLVGMGLVTAEGIAIDALEGRLRTAVVGARSQLECAPQVCAWASIDASQGLYAAPMVCGPVDSPSGPDHVSHPTRRRNVTVVTRFSDAEISP